MPEFPVAVITAAKINVLKGELTVALRIPYDPDEAADMLDEAHELRRLHETEMPVLLAITPFVKQLSLYGTDRRERPPAPSLPEYDVSDWNTPRMADPVQPPDDRPSHTTVDGLLDGGAA